MLYSPPARAAAPNGVAYAGAKLYFYTTGTETPATVYSDSSLTTAHSWPVSADNGGLFPAIYLVPSTSYRALCKSAQGSKLFDHDLVSSATPIVNAADFGATGDGVTNDTVAFKAAHEHARDNGQTLYLDGIYNLTGWDDASDLPLHWVGAPGTRIIANGQSLNFTPSTTYTLTLSSNAVRRQRVVVVASTTGIQTGDIVHFARAENVETYRNESIKRDIARVLTVDSSTQITLDDDLMFDWNTADNASQTITVYRPRKGLLEGIEFVTPATGNTHARSVTLTGFADCTGYRNCRFWAENTGSFDLTFDLEMIQNSANVNPEDCRYGKAGYGFRYGAMRLTTRNCGGVRLQALRGRHLTYPAYWARDGKWIECVADECTAGIDSHNAFRQHWIRCETFGDAEMSNGRSAGGSMVDCVLRCRDSTATASQEGLLVCPQTWVAGYAAIKAESRFVIRNTRVEFTDGTLPATGIVLKAAHGEIDADLECSVSGGTIYMSGAAVGDVSVCRIRSDSITVPVAYTPVIRCPVTLERKSDGGLVSATLSGGRYVIDPFPYGRFGAMQKGGLRVAGQLYASAANELNGTPLVIPVRVFDSPQPYGNSTGMTSTVIAVLRLRVAGGSLTSTRWDTKEYEWTWTHAYGSGAGGSADAETALRSLAAASGNDGNGLALAVGSFAQDANTTISSRNTRYVDFDLTATWAISGRIQVMYDLQLFEANI